MDASYSIKLNDVPVLFDPTGTLWFPDQASLVVSDLHFEKGSSYARKGVFLPPYDTAATLAIVDRLMQHYQPKRVISLGDSFHDAGAEQRMSDGDQDHLLQLCQSTEWIWVLGNHDPQPPAHYPGHACWHYELEGLSMVHEPRADQHWHIAGHLHPVAKISHEKRSLRRKAFICDQQRLIMPSLGAFTGGLNVLDPAYAGLFDHPCRVFTIGAEDIYEVPYRALRGD